MIIDNPHSWHIDENFFTEIIQKDSITPRSHMKLFSLIRMTKQKSLIWASKEGQGVKKNLYRKYFYKKRKDIFLSLNTLFQVPIKLTSEINKQAALLMHIEYQVT